jgi:hypothetical protein
MGMPKKLARWKEARGIGRPRQRREPQNIGKHGKPQKLIRGLRILTGQRQR